MIDAKHDALSRITPEICLDFARHLVSFDSFTGQEWGLAVSIEQDLRRRFGVATELQRFDGGMANVVAKIPGESGTFGLMLNGHLDIDPVVDGWTKNPFAGVIEDGWLYGAGIVNMKAADAAMLAALVVLQKSEVALKHGLIVSLVSGELKGGIGSIKLIESGKRASNVIVGEPTALGIETIHAGIRRIRVTIKGMAAHVAYRENAAGVIEAAARFLTGLPELEGENGEAPLPRLNVGSIRAGIGDTFQSWRPSILPDSCTLLLDVRTAPDQNPDKVLKQLQAILESIRAEDQRFRMKAEWLEPPDHYPRPAYRTDERAELARTVERVHVEVCGNKPRVGDLGKVKYFGSDAPYFQAASMSTVVYGPGQPELMNAPDERIKVDDLVLGAKVYAGLALEICGLVR